MAAVAVSHITADGSEEQHRDLICKTEQAKKRGGASQLVDKPELRRSLHPRANQGNQLSGEKKLEVAVLEGAKARGTVLACDATRDDRAAVVVQSPRLPS